MKSATKRAISIALCLMMLALLVPAIQPEPVQATNHGVYETLAMIYDYGSCPSMQGLGLCGDYFYAVKTDGNDYASTVTRINKDSGTKNMLTNAGNGTYYFYDFGHGNDCEVVVAGGKTNMFIPTSASGSGSLVRYTISGTTATKYGSYQMVSTSGANIGGGAIRAARVDDENIYFLFKSGKTMYTGTLPITQTSGQLVMTKMCTLDTSGVYVNGTYVDLSGFTMQGMGYHDHMLYIPISGHANASTINQSIILVYDLQGASGTIKPLNDPTFRVTSSTYSALFEMESCVIDPETNLMYFNTNRRKTSSDTNYDGVHWISNWVYEPQNRTTAVENYRWEPINNELSSVTTGSSVYNGLAWHHGSVSGTTITDGRYTTDRNIVLEHDRPWVVEWKSSGCTEGELLFATQAVSSFTDAPYIFVYGGNSRVSIGAYSGSQYDNYACDLATYGVDPSTAEVFRLTNKIAADGTNMVWLSVDGKELGPLNQYYVANTSQGTTSDWISGQDFSFSYLGTSSHPINDSIEYIQVWGDGIRGAVDEPDNFLWQTTDNALTPVSQFDYTVNALTLDAGSISGTTYTSVEYDPALDITLLHDRPWSIEWAGSYSSGGMLLAADHKGNTERAPYLFRSGILAFGERVDGNHHNYGIKLSDAGITYSERHVYRLTNKISADGSNMVYLYVDGVEIGAMNNYFKGTSAQGTTVDWLNGRDLTFSHLGAYGYAVSGELEYLQIWEGGIPADATLKDYRWETSGGAVNSIVSDTFAQNGATLISGTITDSTFTSPGYVRLDEQVVLLHDQPWTVQWQSQGSYGGSGGGTMLLAASNTTNLEGAPYLFTTGNYGYVLLGERRGSTHHNYGVNLTALGIDMTAEHTFALTNKPASDGTNMIYLSVDGVEVGAMNNYYQGVASQGTTGDFVSGKDFVFSYLGMRSYPISCRLDYLQVFSSCAHTYGDWVVTSATCTESGSRTHACTNCGYTETETIAPLGHSYDQVTHVADCQNYERIEFICSTCGDCYITYPEALYTDWSETAPSGIDESLIQSKTQYRYSDYETTTSYETSLSGYTQIGSEWVVSGTKTVNYVNSWDSGFDTSNSLYTQYNKKSSKVTASETTTTKTVINSDAIVGYLWFHWCPNSGIYSTQTKTGTYTNFHAFYSTTYTTSNYDDYDSGDGSYCLNSATACSHSTWYWPVAVYAQKSTSYNNLFTYERWTDWSDWSDTEVTASDTRQVETRTVYRYVDGQLGEHSYVDGTCTVCGAACTHSYSSVVTEPTCTGAGYTTHTCTLCGYSYTNNIVSARHSYSSVVTAPTCIDAGYTTYTCTGCGDSYISDSVAATGHSYDRVVTLPTCSSIGYTTYTCTACGDSYTGNTVSVLSHSFGPWSQTQAPTCTTAGQQKHSCTSCGQTQTKTIAATGHNYVDGTCANCGEAEPSDVVVPSTNLAAVTLAFEDEIQYNIYFTADDLSSVEEMGLVTFNEKLTDGTHENAVDIIPGYEVVGSEIRVHTNGIPAKNMGDALYFRVYAKLTDGSYTYGDVAGYHAGLYAKSMLNSTTSSDKQKALCVAMVNYGAEAQLYFNYNTDNLINAFLTDDQKALINAYDATMVDSVVSASSTKTTNFTKNGFSKLSSAVSFEGAFAINYYFTPANTSDGDVVMYWWDAATYNSVDVLTKDNATGVVTMTGTSEYAGSVEGIAAKELDQTVYVCGVYTSSGVEYTTGVLAYSIGHYCKTKAAGTSTMADLAAATAVYGYYAKQYFA